MLAEIIPILEKMHYDELRDFIDYCEYYHLSQYLPKSKDDKVRQSFMKQVRNRRTGLPTGGFPYDFQVMANNTKELTMTTPLQKDGLPIVKTANKKDMITVFGTASTAHDTSAAIAWVLLRSKAPIRKFSEGNIQVKFIPYKQLIMRQDDDGNLVPALDENGNRQYRIVKGAYLYLRYWTVQGDASRKKKRYQNVYIGGHDGNSRREGGYIYRQLADYFYALIQAHGIENTRKVTDKKTGEIKIQTFTTRPKTDDNPIAEFEARIMACIDMTADTPTIDHDCLEALQASL